MFTFKTGRIIILLIKKTHYCPQVLSKKIKNVKIVSSNTRVCKFPIIITVLSIYIILLLLFSLYFFKYGSMSICSPKIVVIDNPRFLFLPKRTHILCGAIYMVPTQRAIWSHSTKTFFFFWRKHPTKTW